MFDFFFFKAEDGIRVVAVTGVQTCALPIPLPRYLNAQRAVFSARPALPTGAAHERAGTAPAEPHHPLVGSRHRRRCGRTGDRKSTRLNSSHGYISYAVFCLKKKKNNNRKRKCKTRVRVKYESHDADTA